MTEFHMQSVEFVSLLSYTPIPNSIDKKILKEMINARNATYAIKSERVIQWDGKEMPMSEVVAEVLFRNLSNIPFSDFFQESTVLIPLPGHSPIRPDSLWVPERISKALTRKGFGSDVVPCLVRSRPVNKSSSSTPENRPTATIHYESFDVTKSITDLEDVVLIDDVITRGGTLMGAANKLADEIPGIRIRGFAAVRTISNPLEFNSLVDPVKGIISLYPTGGTHREP